MSNNTTESGWQRFLNWIKGTPQKPGEPGTAGSSHANEASEQPKAKQVNTWEDEGGATPARAAGGGAAPAPPADPPR